MSYYFVASIRIRDEQEYQKYLERAGQIFARYGGTYLAVDNEVEVLEGGWDYDRSVLIQFSCKEDFQAWYDSEDYQDILQYRLSAADCDTILVKGK
jgi:uncharacterized protein (DUF1330 family)